MKKLILLLHALIVSNLTCSQTGPAGVGNTASNGIWLSVEQNAYIDDGDTPGEDGSAIQQWSDASGNDNHAIQTTNNLKPDLNTNALNGFSTLTFGGNDRILSSGVTSTAQLSIFVVVQFHDLVNNNDGIIQASPTGTAFTTNVGDKSIGMWINRPSSRIWGRGIQANNGARNLPQNAALTTGRFYIIGQDFNGTHITQYVDGTAVGAVTYNNTMKNWSEFGIGRQGNESLNGDLAEIIVHNVSLNAAQRIITENYLAAKYGLTLSNNNVYTQDEPANGNHDFEVAGIGRVNAANVHDDAQGTGMIRVLNPTDLDDDEFFIWGHDNGTAFAEEFMDIPAGIDARLSRVWRISEVNTSGNEVDVGNIDMRWDLNGLGPVTASDLRLLIDENNNGDFSDETPISGAVDLGDGIYEFQDVPSGAGGTRNNCRLTLATINAPQTPLPIELVRFDATAQDDYIKLEWQTASERNNEYFTIEQSTNGIDWEEVQKIDGAGNSNELLHYTAKHFNPYKGTTYYRLKQTDFDGKFEYSDIRSVNVNELGMEPVDIYPNPASHQITLKSAATELSEIAVYNTLGQKMAVNTTKISADQSSLTIDVSNYANGIYYIKTTTATNMVVKQ